MTGEELEKTKARILELQAQLDAKVARLSEKVDRIGVRATRLTEKVGGSVGDVDDTPERIAALLAKLRERQRRKTD
jgi:predicted nuclease with TOPRIM domain